MNPSDRTSSDRPVHPVQTTAATVDLDRRRRCGYPEVIYGPGKTAEQICEIVAALQKHGEPVLATRVDESQAAALSAAFTTGRFNKVARTFRLGANSSDSASTREMT